MRTLPTTIHIWFQAVGHREFISGFTKETERIRPTFQKFQEKILLEGCAVRAVAGIPPMPGQEFEIRDIREIPVTIAFSDLTGVTLVYKNLKDLTRS